MIRKNSDYPFDTRHPDATAGILPPETREVLLKAGWIHESETCAISNTLHSGRRRWNLPHAMIGNERYHRIEDILQKLDESYNEHKSSLAAREHDEQRIRTALA